MTYFYKTPSPVSQSVIDFFTAAHQVKFPGNRIAILDNKDGTVSIACSGEQIVNLPAGFNCLDVSPIWQPPPPTPEDAARQAAELAAAVNADIDRQIVNKEQTALLPRVTREFMLAAFAAQAAAAGVDPMLNVGFARMKALDDEIAALRRSKV